MSRKHPLRPGVFFSAALVAFVAVAGAPGCSSSEVPLCGDGIERVLEGITANPPYDSLEKRVGNQVIAATEDPCENATDGSCKAAYDKLAASAIGEVLIATRGNEAIMFTRVTMELLGGEIDTAAEAGLWAVGIANLGTQCGAIYELVARPTDDGRFEVTRGAAYPGNQCVRTTLVIARDGTKARTSGSEECPSGAVLPGADGIVYPPDSF